MSLALEKSYIVQQDLITVGSIVFTRGSPTKHRVQAISKNRESAWITYGNDATWWPVSELVFESQLDFFEPAYA